MIFGGGGGEIYKFTPLLIEKLSLYRPRQVVRALGGEAPRISRQSARDGEGCQPYRPATFTPQDDSPGTHFCKEAELTPGP